MQVVKEREQQPLMSVCLSYDDEKIVDPQRVLTELEGLVILAMVATGWDIFGIPDDEFIRGDVPDDECEIRKAVMNEEWGRVSSLTLKGRHRFWFRIEGLGSSLKACICDWALWQRIDH